MKNVENEHVNLCQSLFKSSIVNFCDFDFYVTKDDMKLVMLFFKHMSLLSFGPILNNTCSFDFLTNGLCFDFQLRLEG